MKLQLIMLCALAAAAGCQRDSGGLASPRTAAHAAKKPVVEQRGPTPEELTAGMVEAATEGKSQAPITLKFDLLRRPVQGEPLEIAIALLPQEAADPLSVDVSGPEELKLGANDAQFEFAAVEAAQVYRHRITVTPTGEGVFLLTLSVSMKRDQLADTRVFSVPIIVEAPSAAVPQKPATPTS